MTKLNIERQGYKKTPLGWIPQEWSIVSFGKIVESSQSGLSIPSSEEGTIPILGMGHIQDGKIISKICPKVSLTEHE